MAKIAFCQDVLVEFMGYMSMAALLKQAGHQVEVFYDDQMDQDSFVGEVASFKPDLVGFSVLSPTVPWALGTAQKIKSQINSLVIFGNVHAIFNHDLIEHPAVDILCIGEGEYPLLELAQRLDQGREYHDIESLIVKTPQGVCKNQMGPLADVNDLPFSDRTIYDKFSFFAQSPYQRVLLGRGCPYHCRFCTNPSLVEYFGQGYLRKMTPERAIAELEHQVAGRDPKYLVISDEVLWVKNRWLREFMALYQEKIKARFIANFRWGPIEESDIRMMAEAGAEGFILAVESGDEHQRRVKFGKNVKDAEILKIAALLNKYRIKFTVSAFFGIPGDTVEDHLQRADFYRQINATYLWTTFFQPYPGTAMLHDPDVIECMPRAKDFDQTLHNDSYLEVPDQERLVNLKKVYYWAVKYVGLRKPLIWLTKLKVPFIFDGLFLLHFSRYILVFEKVSPRQYLFHLKQFAIQPLMRRFSGRSSGAAQG